MKRCPKCQTNYFDNILDFCLDDGEKLILLERETKLKEISPNQAQTLAFNDFDKSTPTVSLPKDLNLENKPENSAGVGSKSENLKRDLTEKSLKTLEVAPMIFALTHNFWQWLYLARKNYYDFSGFFLSFEFIIWLLLLLAALVFGIISLKYSKNKVFAIMALIVLAINVLLSIVPK